MNAVDVLRYGHRTLLHIIDKMPPTEWETPGACGVWSSREIVAHLSSYELVLLDILSSLLHDGATPRLARFLEAGNDFNDDEVAVRSSLSPSQVLNEINQAHAESLVLAAQISPEVLSRPGTLPWYGAEYALDDLIVYMYYGHKREHGAQIDAFCDRLRRQQG
jgi:hypothetical protein